MRIPTPSNTAFDIVQYIEQSPLLLGIVVTAVGGLIVAAILSALGKVPALRPAFAKTAMFMKALRPVITTASRQEDVIKNAKKKAISSWTKRIRPLYEAGKTAAWRAGNREGYERGFADRDAEVVAERAKPVPAPRWGVRRTSDPDWYLLDNAGWLVTNVGLDAPADEFVFGEQPEWDDLGSNARGGSIGKQFKGTVQHRGRRLGVTFTVTWTDANGDRRSAPVVLDREPLKPVIL